MKNVSTGVSLCLDTSKLARVQAPNFWMFQCVQTTVMIGLKHARTTQHVLRIGVILCMMTIVPPIAVHKIQCAALFKRYMETVKACVIEYGEMNTFTPLTWTTAQWCPSTTVCSILTSSLHSHGVAACLLWSLAQLWSLEHHYWYFWWSLLPSTDN